MVHWIKADRSLLDSELRRDPVSKRWVIIKLNRDVTPESFRVEPEKMKGGPCVFCSGNEVAAGMEILAYRTGNSMANSPGWLLRVVPNKFPALRIEGDLGKKGIGLYDMMNGVGAHEVIIETPEHELTFDRYDLKQVERIIWSWRDRILDLRQDRRFKYILIFKNFGQAAGASMEHGHCQLIATPVVPKRVMEEIENCKEYYDYRERCLFCDGIMSETESGERLIYENQHFIVFAPFASRSPFEAWVVPRYHSSDFSAISREMVSSLAGALHTLIKKLADGLNMPPFNFILHTSPLDEKELPHYHWHIEVIPRLGKTSGFEWGTGFHVNPCSPEKAAEFLRDSASREKQN